MDESNRGMDRFERYLARLERLHDSLPSRPQEDHERRRREYGATMARMASRSAEIIDKLNWLTNHFHDLRTPRRDE